MKISKSFRVILSIKDFLKDYLNLDEDKADELQTIELIKKGVEFRGTNLWVLIFAIMIASVGLNVNSTAVVIGAMLISPLMGPIMGIGLGVGINDFALIKKSFKNLGVAVLISIITSTLYFWITPLGDAYSELLARTTPTIWDVLIALFGGLAGIVAASRKHFSNVIPGVAIATALMPPLCTAGYGLATGRFSFFIGALFLFFINSVFISLSTIIIVRFLKYPQNKYTDKNLEKKIKTYIYIIVAVTVIPSIFMAYQIVNRSIFIKNAESFIQNELTFNSSFIVGKNIAIKSGKKTVEIFTIGNIDDEKIRTAKEHMKNYNLEDAELIVKQSDSYGKPLDLTAIKTGLIEDLYKKNEQIIKTKDEKITLLEKELLKYEFNSFPAEDLFSEAKTQHKNLKELFVSNVVVASEKEKKLDTTTVAYAKFGRQPGFSELQRFKNWIEARLKTEKVKLIIQ
jgi:uncharacterized hydrophobic protein (TIGR00271 family)